MNVAEILERMDHESKPLNDQEMDDRVAVGMEL
jgi:hypothetical protein